MKLIKFTAITAIVGSLFAQQATAAQLYTETVAGPVALPAGTYGAITTTTNAGATLLVAAKEITTFVNGEIVYDNGVTASDLITHTISFWYQTATLADKAIYTATTGAGSAYGYDLNLKSDGKLEVKTSNGGGTLTTDVAQVPAATWTHVAITITSDIVARKFDAVFYINGAAVTKTGSPVNSGVNGQPAKLIFADGETFAGIYVDDTALDAATVISTAKSSIGPKGLVFHYELNEEPGATKVTDSTGNYPDSESLDASITLGGSTATPETDRYSVLITADTMGVEIEQTYTIVSGITYVAWIKPTGTSSDFTSIIGSQNSNPNLLTINANNKLALQWGGRWQDSTSPIVAPAGEWSLVALTMDSTTGTPTVVAGLATNADLTSHTFTANGAFENKNLPNMRFAKGFNGPNRTFFGRMRNVRMFDYNLTIPELEAIFDAEKANVLPAPIAQHALSFDGTDDRITIPNSNELDLNATNFSFAAWIKPTAVTSTRAVIIMNGQNSVSWENWAVFLNQDKLVFSSGSGGGAPAENTGSTSIIAGVWTHIAVTYDGGALVTYVNGVVDQTVASGVVQPGTITTNTQIGGDAKTNGSEIRHMFAGTIDEISIWNKTLSVAEIAGIKAETFTQNASNQVEGSVTSTQIESLVWADLMAYFPLNEGTGTTTTDLSPNAFVGTFANSSEPTWVASSNDVGSLNPLAPKVLILHYTFDETSGTTVTDSIGANNITTATTTKWNSDGVFGGAYDLTDNNLTLVPLDPFNTLTTVATVSFWLKGATSNTNNTIVKGLKGSNQVINIHLPYSDGNVYVDLGTDDTTTVGDRVSFSQPTAVNDNQWHHWVMTKDSVSGDLKVYLDKAPVTVTGSGSLHNNFVDLTEMTFGNDTNGLIDNFKLFNYAMTAAEVTALDALPQAMDDEIKTPNDVTITIFVKADNGHGVDVDPNSAPVVLVSDNTTGILTPIDLATGEFQFTPTAGTEGTSSFVYSLEGSEATVSITTTPKGLLLHYTFDETSGTTAVDSIAGHNATTNSEAWDTDGKFGGSCNIDGNAITMAIEPFNTLSSTMTLSFWFKGAADNPNNTFMSGLNSTGANGRELNIHLAWGGLVYLDCGANNTASYDRTSASARGADVDNTWHHWVFSKNTTTGNMRIYLDTEEIVEGSGKTKLIGTFVSATIGGGAKGLIDNLKLFDYELTADEVSNLDSVGAKNDYVSIANDSLTSLQIDVKANNGKGPDDDPLNESVTLVQNNTNGTLVLTDAANGIFTYTPTPNSVGTTTFIYYLGSVDNQATVYITTTGQGMVFHYKLNEEPGVSVVRDSTGQFPDSNTLASSINLTGVAGGLDPSLYLTAETGTNGEPIQISGVNTNIGPDCTFVAWVKPKIGETFSDFTGLLDDLGNLGFDINMRIGNIANAPIDTKLTLVSDSSAWSASKGQREKHEIYVGRWNLIAVTVAGDQMTLATGVADEDCVDYSPLVSSYTFTNAGASGPKTITGFSLGDTSVKNPFRGFIRNLRCYNYALPITTTRAGLSIQQLFDLEKGKIITPVLGLTVEQNDNILSWRYLSDSLVNEFQIINSDTGEVIATVIPTLGKTSYEYILPDGVRAHLIAKDSYGEQTFYPEDGNTVRTDYILKKGWNLIAITGNNPDLAELQASITGPIWGWNGGNYEHTTTIGATQAVWVKCEGLSNVTIRSDKSDQLINLLPGWNLVGPSKNLQKPDTAISVFSYDRIYNQISNETNTLIEGVGYWIFAL